MLVDTGRLTWLTLIWLPYLLPRPKCNRTQGGYCLEGCLRGQQTAHVVGQTHHERKRYKIEIASAEVLNKTAITLNHISELASCSSRTGLPGISDPFVCQQP